MGNNFWRTSYDIQPSHNKVCNTIRRNADCTRKFGSMIICRMQKVSFDREQQRKTQQMGMISVLFAPALKEREKRHPPQRGIRSIMPSGLRYPLLHLHVASE